MHRTLKEETTRPAALTLRLQQKKFDRFRQVFNYERPHEGLNNATPGSIYQPSAMTLPRNLIEFLIRKDLNSGESTTAATSAGTKAGCSLARSFDLRLSASSRSRENFYKAYFRDVEIGEFDAEALRFRPVQVMRRMDVRSQFRQARLPPACQEQKIKLNSTMRDWVSESRVKPEPTFSFAERLPNFPLPV